MAGARYSWCAILLLLGCILITPLTTHATHDQASADIILDSAEFYQPDAVRFTLSNPAYHSPIIGPSGKQASVILRFEWLDDKQTRTLASRDLDLTDALRTALNADVRRPTGGFWLFDSLKHSPIGELLRTPTIATAEARWLRITIDADRAVTEANEDNNTVTLKRPLPDLKFIGGATAFRDHVIFALLQNPRNFFLGDDHALKIRFTWLDAKKSPMGGWHEWDASEFVSQGSRPGLSRVGGEPALLTFDSVRAIAGMPAVRTYLQSPPPRSRYLRLAIDAAQLIPESREDNNIRDLDRPMADLIIREVEWLEYLNDGRTWPWRYLAFEIANTGTAYPFSSAPNNIVLRFSWRNRTSQLGDGRTWNARDLIMTPAMQRDGFVRFSSTSAAARPVQDWLHGNRPKGATQLHIEVDVLNAIEERNEGNNAYTQPVGGLTKGTITRQEDQPFWQRGLSYLRQLFGL